VQEVDLVVVRDLEAVEEEDLVAAVD